MLKLKEEVRDDSISVFDLPDGEIAMITTWPLSKKVGMLVQRWGESLIALGLESGKSWTTFFKTSRSDNKYRVRILRIGTTLVIEK